MADGATAATPTWTVIGVWAGAVPVALYVTPGLPELHQVTAGAPTWPVGWVRIVQADNAALAAAQGLHWAGHP